MQHYNFALRILHTVIRNWGYFISNFILFWFQLHEYMSRDELRSIFQVDSHDQGKTIV